MAYKFDTTTSLLARHSHPLATSQDGKDPSIRPHTWPANEPGEWDTSYKRQGGEIRAYERRLGAPEDERISRRNVSPKCQNVRLATRSKPWAHNDSPITSQRPELLQPASSATHWADNGASRVGYKHRNTRERRDRGRKGFLRPRERENSSQKAFLDRNHSFYGPPRPGRITRRAYRFTCLAHHHRDHPRALPPTYNTR